MIKYLKSNLIIGILFSFTSCGAFLTSMTPSQVYDTLPTLTKSTFLSQTQAETAVNRNRCKCLVKGRSYAASSGLTVKEDLKKAAKGIDEWVQLDGGNAYVLVNYKLNYNGHFWVL